jgi:hypothetical protein
MEVYVCLKTKPHRDFFPRALAEMHDLGDAIAENRVQTEVWFDDRHVMFLSPRPLRLVEIVFLMWDLREMRGKSRRGASYYAAMLSVWGSFYDSGHAPLRMEMPIRDLLRDEWLLELRGRELFDEFIKPDKGGK